MGILDDPTSMTWDETAIRDDFAAADSLTRRGTDPREIDSNVDLTGTADTGPTIRAALVFGDVVLPRGTLKIIGDLTITADRSTIRGMGDGTHLAFVDGGIVFDGVSTFTSECLLQDIRISRKGTAGPAIRLKGGGSGTGVVRTNVVNVRVSSSTGQALLIDGSYIATFVGCYFTGSTIGIEIAADSVAGTVFGNLLTFMGGETQGNVVGAKIDGGVAVNFYGHGIEGNTRSGVELVRNTRGVGFYGCYFEANVGWDIKIGTSSGGCIATCVKGSFFTDGAGAKKHAIILVRSYGTSIEGNTFGSGYTSEPIDVREKSPGNVTGYARDNVASRTTGSGVVALNGATVFNTFTFGRDGSTPIAQHYKVSGVLNWPRIAANSERDMTMTLTGTVVGDDATAHPHGMLEMGLSISHVAVTATNTVTVRLRNNTGSAIDPAPRTWRVRAWR